MNLKLHSPPPGAAGYELALKKVGTDFVLSVVNDRGSDVGACLLELTEDGFLRFYEDIDPAVAAAVGLQITKVGRLKVTKETA